VHLTATAATRLLSNASRLLANATGRTTASWASWAASRGSCCDQDECGCTAPSPDGQHFQAAPRMVWAVSDSTALVGGEDVGPPGRLPHQDRLGDFWLPQRGIFAVGTARFDTHEQLATTPPRRQEGDRARVCDSARRASFSDWPGARAH
jgi:hypothetical protein